MDLAESNYELDINPKKVCRLCLAQPSKLYNIFSNSIVDGYIISVPEMLDYTVDITVTADDKLPSKICADCRTQIGAFYTFKRKTKRTEESLLSMFAPEANILTENIITETVHCPLCDAVFENGDAYIEHAQQEHHDVNIYEIESESVKTSDENVKEPEFEEYNIYGETSDEAEAIANEQDMLAIEEELVVVEPKRNLRSRRGASSKTQEVEAAPSTQEAKPKRSPKSSNEKPSTSKMVYKTEYSDIDEIMDTNDENYEYQSGSESSNVYECPLCESQFAERDEYIKHCEQHKGTQYQCDGCTEFFIDEDQLLQHECEMTETDLNEEDLMCVPCNKRMKSTAQFRQHKKMHDCMSLIIDYMEFFPCHDCCLLFISKEKLSEHNAKVHAEKDSKELSSLSDKIDDSCTDYQFLDGEMQTMLTEEYKEDETYSCGECDLPFQTITELKYHVILHANKFLCPDKDCGCQYDQMSRLSIHVLNKHINMKSLQCLHCNQSFQTYDDLQAHLKNFCKEKKFRCPECDKKFFSKKALTTHLRTLKEKRFKCKMCGKTFKQQGELTIHLRSHTNERPFQCTICKNSYKTSSMRAAHMDSHIKGKTFECTLCDKKLQSRTSYRNHMKRHNEEKKHECQHCGKRFFTRYHLKLHQSKIHKVLADGANNSDLVQLIDDGAMIVFE